MALPFILFGNEILTPRKLIK